MTNSTPSNEVARRVAREECVVCDASGDAPELTLLGRNGTLSCLERVTNALRGHGFARVEAAEVPSHNSDAKSGWYAVVFSDTRGHRNEITVLYQPKSLAEHPPPETLISTDMTIPDKDATAPL
jgi:hypothetical protein